MVPRSSDRPLTRTEEVVVLLACLLLTPLIGVVAYFWWRDSSPQRARSLFELGAALGRYLLPMLLAAAALLLLAHRLAP